MTSNLATQLREGTSKSHTMAENVNFIKSFLGGVIDKSSYVEMLSKLFFVYEAMEKAMEENKNHEYAWTIKSSQGQTIFSNQSKQFEKIDVSQLSAGVYFLEIELGNEKVTKRLVKQ